VINPTGCRHIGDERLWYITARKYAQNAVTKGVHCKTTCPNKDGVGQKKRLKLEHSHRALMVLQARCGSNMGHVAKPLNTGKQLEKNHGGKVGRERSKQEKGTVY